MTSNDQKNLLEDLKVFFKWILSTLIDSLFLIIWVYTQWFANLAIEKIQLSEIDQFTLTTFQILFAISTLAPIVIYIFRDIAIMFFQAKRRIRYEKDLSKPKAKKNA